MNIATNACSSPAGRAVAHPVRLRLALERVVVVKIVPRPWTLLSVVAGHQFITWQVEVLMFGVPTGE